MKGRVPNTTDVTDLIVSLANDLIVSLANGLIVRLSNDLIVSLANDRFEMVAADVVEPDSVVVEVVEHSQTKLVSFTVVRLRKAISETIKNNYKCELCVIIWHFVTLFIRHFENELLKFLNVRSSYIAVKEEYLTKILKEKGFEKLVK